MAGVACCALVGASLVGRVLTAVTVGEAEGAASGGVDCETTSACVFAGKTGDEKSPKRSSSIGCVEGAGETADTAGAGERGGAESNEPNPKASSSLDDTPALGTA